jgi:Mce-associated membrane protein
VSQEAPEAPEVEQPDPVAQWRMVAGVLAVLLLAAVVTLGVLISKRDPETGSSSGSAGAQQLQEAEHAAEQAARKDAVALTTYDWSSLEADFAWAKSDGTTAFQARYAQVSAPIRDFVLKIKAHAVGSVVASAATAKDADHVTVLLFVDQAITNETNSERRLDQPRMSMSMVRSGGRWLVDDVKINNLTDS